MDLSVLYNSNGDLIAGIENIQFYRDKGILHVYEYIMLNTVFLDSATTSIKERIFYIFNDLTELQLCPHCCINKRKYQANKKSLTNTCGSNVCKKSKIHRRDTSHLYVNKECQCGNTFKVSIKSGMNKQYCTRKCYISFRNYRHSLDTILKIRESNKRKHSDPIWRLSMKEIYEQSHKKISETMKTKILAGTFTPCITNSWTRWTAAVCIDGKNKKFRSFWEATFYLLTPGLEFEKIRIPYILDNQSHSYIVDFVDEKNKILYEIKPKSTKDSELNQLKFQYATTWAKDNGYSFVVISDDWFRNNVNRLDFNEHPQLYNSMKQFL